MFAPNSEGERVVDLIAESKRLIAEAKSDLDDLIGQYPNEIVLLQPEIYNIEFPIRHYPEKIVSLSLDKTPEVAGVFRVVACQLGSAENLEELFVVDDDGAFDG